MEDDPVQVKFECRSPPPCKHSKAVHILSHNFRTVTDSEESSIQANRKSTMGFYGAINQGCASPLTSPKGVQIPKFNVFRINVDKKHKKSAT